MRWTRAEPPSVLRDRPTAQVGCASAVARRHLHAALTVSALGARCLILRADVLLHVDARRCACALRGTVPIDIFLHLWTSLVLFIMRLRWVLRMLRSTMRRMCSVLGFFCVIVLGLVTSALFLALHATRLSIISVLFHRGPCGWEVVTSLEGRTAADLADVGGLPTDPVAGAASTSCTATSAGWPNDGVTATLLPVGARQLGPLPPCGGAVLASGMGPHTARSGTWRLPAPFPNGCLHRRYASARAHSTGEVGGGWEAGG